MGTEISTDTRYIHTDHNDSWCVVSLSLSPAVILVYGSSLEAHTAVQDLLTGGVAPGLITFIRPHPPTCFNNQIVEQRVQRSLEETGVVLLTDHTLSGVKEGGACLVTEEGEEEAVFVTCQVSIYLSLCTCIQCVFTGSDMYG